MRNGWIALSVVFAASFLTEAAAADAREDLRGAGATFPYAVFSGVSDPCFWCVACAACRILVYEKWMLAISSKSQTDKVTFSYNGTNSKAGRQCVKDGACGFAGTDSAPSAEERAQAPGLWLFPVLAGAVAIGFNLPDYADLELRIPRQSLADIFLGRVSHWSNLSQWNPRLKDVHQSIDLVVRSDSSGTSETLTSALSSFSSEWKGKVGTSSKPNWPVHAIAADSTDAVALTILRQPYSLGYLSLANSFDIPTACIQNRFGQFVAPSASSVEAAIDDVAAKSVEEMGRDETIFAQSIVDPRNMSAAYPISTLSYILFDLNANATLHDCQRVQRVVYLLYWAWTDPRAAEIALGLSFAPLSAAMRSALLAKLQNLDCGDVPESGSKEASPSARMSLLERVKYTITPIVIGAGASSP
jgi:phosphate transport system substrate-binding protein